MPRYAALLRAINVGGHVVTMDRLRALFEELDFARVESFIASGNILFDAGKESPARLERRIEEHLHAALGYEVATFLRTGAELQAIATLEPFGPAPAGEKRNVYVTFHREPPPAAYVERLLSYRSAVDDFQVIGRESWWACRGSSSDSPYFKVKPDRTVVGTALNITTVRKLAAKLAR